MLQHRNVSYNMSPIGLQVPLCTRINIADDDRIVGIDAESDGLTLRKITVHLEKGEGKVFGGFTGPWNEHPVHRYDFTRKVDLLGVYGMVAQDPKNSALDGKLEEHIMTLGFIVNECPIRNMTSYIN